MAKQIQWKTWSGLTTAPITITLDECALLELEDLNPVEPRKGSPPVPHAARRPLTEPAPTGKQPKKDDFGEYYDLELSA